MENNSTAFAQTAYIKYSNTNSDTNNNSIYEQLTRKSFPVFHQNGLVPSSRFRRPRFSFPYGETMTNRYVPISDFIRYCTVSERG